MSDFKFCFTILVANLKMSDICNIAAGKKALFDRITFPT